MHTERPPTPFTTPNVRGASALFAVGEDRVGHVLSTAASPAPAAPPVATGEPGDTRQTKMCIPPSTYALKRRSSPNARWCGGSLDATCAAELVINQRWSSSSVPRPAPLLAATTRQYVSGVKSGTTGGGVPTHDGARGARQRDVRPGTSPSARHSALISASHGSGAARCRKLDVSALEPCRAETTGHSRGKMRGTRHLCGERRDPVARTREDVCAGAGAGPVSSAEEYVRVRDGGRQSRATVVELRITALQRADRVPGCVAQGEAQRPRLVRAEQLLGDRSRRSMCGCTSSVQPLSIAAA
ncbi:hypothetical protein FB451DRAFT_1280085 [Mycena latifolia]|nr:hypothetical protein FB451DRAFT_1280085 [Mycena latifolia]